MGLYRQHMTPRAAAGLARDLDSRPSSSPVNLRRATVLGVLGGILVVCGAVSANAAEPTVNVNTADAGELQYLPGVGPSLASYILAAREEGWECKGDPLKLDGADDHLLSEIYRIGEKTQSKLVDAGARCEGPTTATGPLGRSSKASTAKYGKPTTSR